MNAKQRCPPKYFGLRYVKGMVSMATHSEFEKGEGLPTKLLISQLLLILDY